MSTAAEFEDKEIICVDCSEPFIWEAGAQAFFQDKGLTNQPKRCAPCKETKRQRVAEAAMRPEDRPRVTIEVTCAQCGTETTVPFVPVRNRPVYCRQCFLAHREDREHLESVL